MWEEWQKRVEQRYANAKPIPKPGSYRVKLYGKWNKAIVSESGIDVTGYPFNYSHDHPMFKLADVEWQKA